MQINMDALFSLQIFEDENHASIHSDKTKEGLSLFGILNSTKTTLGRALMREWFLRPSMSLEVINARHDAVACFLRSDNVSIKNAMQGHLNGTKNVPRIFGAIRTGKAKVSDWQALVKVIKVDTIYPVMTPFIHGVVRIPRVIVTRYSIGAEGR